MPKIKERAQFVIVAPDLEHAGHITAMFGEDGAVSVPLSDIVDFLLTCHKGIRGEHPNTSELEIWRQEFRDAADRVDTALK